MWDLNGKICLITGSSMGLGKAYASAFSRVGATVVVNDPDGGELARNAVEEIERGGGKAFLAACDIAKPEQVEKMVKDVLQRYNRIDILINNAGISSDATTINFDLGKWDDILRINLNGAFYCIKYCLPSMIENRWGRIINISSVVGQIGVIGTPAYTASKAALIGFTKTLAKEVAKKGITVNCLALGYFQGGGLLNSVPGKMAEQILGQIPIGRWGTPEDVTGLLNYLVSDSAAYITGQTLHVNGGIYM
jgi:3-oxoacyl-[acyl-carrier protein] reductase